MNPRCHHKLHKVSLCSARLLNRVSSPWCIKTSILNAPAGSCPNIKSRQAPRCMSIVNTHNAFSLNPRISLLNYWRGGKTGLVPEAQADSRSTMELGWWCWKMLWSGQKHSAQCPTSNLGWLLLGVASTEPTQDNEECEDTADSQAVPGCRLQQPCSAALCKNIILDTHRLQLALVTLRCFVAAVTTALDIAALHLTVQIPPSDLLAAVTGILASGRTTLQLNA